MVSPGASGALRGASRVSIARVGVIGTNRPAVAVASGTNQPVTSTITGAPVRLSTASVPVALSPTMVPLARTSPGQWLTIDAVGTAAPSGQIDT